MVAEMSSRTQSLKDAIAEHKERAGLAKPTEPTGLDVSSSALAPALAPASAEPTEKVESDAAAESQAEPPRDRSIDFLPWVTAEAWTQADFTKSGNAPSKAVPGGGRSDISEGGGQLNVSPDLDHEDFSRNVDWDAFMNRLYQRVCADPNINGFFRGSKFDFLKAGQSCFFFKVWNGDTPYLREDIHAVWAISQHDFDVFLEHLREAMIEHGSEEGAEYLHKRLYVYKPTVICNFCHMTKKPEDPEPQAEEGATLSQKSLLSKKIRVAFQRAQIGGQLPTGCVSAMAEYFNTVMQRPEADPMPFRPEGLRAAHENMYIGPCTYELLRKEMKVDGLLQAPAILRAVDEVEAEVTHDMKERINKALSKRVLSSKLNDTIYLWSVMRDWYQSMKTDTMLCQFFGRSTGSADKVAKEQFQFIYNALMSPSRSSWEARSLTRLRDIHSQLVITDVHFDRFCFRLSRCIRDPQAMDDLVAFVETFRKVVVRRALVADQQVRSLNQVAA